MFRSFVVRLIATYVIVLGIGFCLIYFWAVRARHPDDRLLFVCASFVFMLVLAALFTWIHYRLLIYPLQMLNMIIERIAKGDYGNRIKTDAYDSQVREVSENVNMMASEFENLEEMRKSFVASASHELRSPLTSMQGFLMAVIDGTITTEADRLKYLNIVYSETKRLSSLINSMLDLSRMESGKSTLSPTCFDINELIRRVVIRFEPTLVKKEMQLDIDFVNEVNNVFADRERIEQVVINLIDNAIKYSPTQSRILIVTHIHSKKLYVSVKDTGIGISKKDQLLIWDRFYMSDKARTPSKSKGTGLGLSIVKKIIEDHQEIIWVESNKGAGSTFIFTLTLYDPARHRGTKLLEIAPSSRPIKQTAKPQLPARTTTPTTQPRQAQKTYGNKQK